MIGDIPGHWRVGKRLWYAPWRRTPSVWVPPFTLQDMQRAKNEALRGTLMAMNKVSGFQGYLKS